MTFEEMYPDAVKWDQPAEPQHMVMKVETAEPCWHCQKPTTWIEINFEAFLCSPECDDAKWNEYWEACRRSDERAGKRNAFEGGQVLRPAINMRRESAIRH